MEKKFAEIINEGKKNGKKLSEINAELKAAGEMCIRDRHEPV